jgi:hypothetical protein
MYVTPGKEQDISVVSYYGSMKNIFVNQWGQIYSYDTIDTGFQRKLNSGCTDATVFGGDTFILDLHSKQNFHSLLIIE